MIRIDLGDYTSYEKIKYPAGELQVRLKSEFLNDVGDKRKANGIANDAILHVQTVARIQSSEDIIELILLADALWHRHLKPQQLILPYLPYGRADRRFVEGDCHGLMTFARTIDYLYSQVITLDAHSDVARDVFSQVEFVNKNPRRFIRSAIEHFQNTSNEQLAILFPDQGALSRYSESIDTSIPQFYATKVRDPVTGKLKEFDVPNIEGDYKILIVDDLCDGGGTFLGIAKKIDRSIPLGLYVTHGIFSKGFSDLLKNFKYIYTTNSFSKRDICPSHVIMHYCERDLLS